MWIGAIGGSHSPKSPSTDHRRKARYPCYLSKLDCHFILTESNIKRRYKEKIARSMRGR
jgi:hypothetical protein